MTLKQALIEAATAKLNLAGTFERITLERRSTGWALVLRGFDQSGPIVAAWYLS